MQEELVLKDFNVEKEAGGVDVPVIRKFNQTQVKNSILEIRFHWAGKGTTIIPEKGSYGSLISAISVDPGKCTKFSFFVSLVSPLFYCTECCST